MIRVRPAQTEDVEWVLAESARVGGPRVVSRGTLFDLARYPALVAWHEGDRVGLAIYHAQPPEAELLAIAATQQWQGAGTALLMEVEALATRAGCERIALVTTNDNTDALRFYQRRGYRLTAVHPDAFDEVLRLKGLTNDAPVIGHHDIVIRDELLLTKALVADPPA